MLTTLKALGVATVVFCGLVTLANLPTSRAQKLPDRTGGEAVFVLTESEQLHLTNLQLQRRAIEAEYAAEETKLLLDERAYADAVMVAHPGAQVVFDTRTVAWVHKLVGAEGASGGK